MKRVSKKERVHDKRAAKRERELGGNERFDGRDFRIKAKT